MQQRRSPAPAPGPRTWNRLAWLAVITGGPLAVIGLIYYATGIGDSSTKHIATPSVTVTVTTSRQDQRYRCGEMTLGIAYGTTPQELLGEIGPPTRKQARCWLYRGRVGRIRGRYSGPYVDAMKFCFGAGPVGGKVMTRILSHYAAHTIKGEHFRGQWHPPVTLMRVPDWYLQRRA